MDDERNDLATQMDTETTRRRLLRAATGGFALAACGLFLPSAFDDEADARDGALGGAKGGRRRKDHRGHEKHQRKRRDHGDKKDKGKDDRPPGSGWSLTPYVALRVVAGDLAPSTISVDFYFRVKSGLNEFGPLVFAQSAEGLMNGNADYAPNRYSIAAYIRGDALPTPVFIEYANTFFTGTYGLIAKGGAVDGNGQYVGGTKLASGTAIGLPMEFDLGKWTDSVVERDMKLSVKGLDVNVSDTHYWLQPTIQWR